MLSELSQTLKGQPAGLRPCEAPEQPGLGTESWEVGLGAGAAEGVSHAEDRVSWGDQRVLGVGVVFTQQCGCPNASELCIFKWLKMLFHAI